jgi:hypothetical protein
MSRNAKIHSSSNDEEEDHTAWNVEIGENDILPDGSPPLTQLWETESSDDRSSGIENSDQTMARKKKTLDCAGRRNICGLSKLMLCLVCFLVLGGGIGTLAMTLSQRSASSSKSDVASCVVASIESVPQTKKSAEHCGPSLPVPTLVPTDVPSSLPTIEVLTTSTGASSATDEPAEHCGCYDCTEQVWNAIAGEYTCGERISYVAGDTSKYPTEEDACRLVAGKEFPKICGSGCNPDSCDGRTPPVAPDTFTPESSLYCFPEYAQRTRFENVWGKYTVEVKEGSSCGPGGNKFTTNTVSVDNDELKLQFKKGDNGWEGSEVRVILPEEEMPYTYGTYSFSVKTVSVIDADTSAVIDTVLPQSLIIGLFTWDDTDIYAVNENWNHEVDIEISRWNISGDPDAQFLVQPPLDPQLYRFYSGADSTYDQGGHVYDFTWNPGKVDWYTDAAGGKNHSYATEDAIFAGLDDYVQCLPADVEIRMNLWNMFGSAMPVGMSDNQVVEVIIDDFTFTPSNLEYVMNGGYCTKHCHCDPSSLCLNGICTKRE